MRKDPRIFCAGRNLGAANFSERQLGPESRRTFYFDSLVSEIRGCKTVQSGVRILDLCNKALEYNRVSTQPAYAFLTAFIELLLYRSETRPSIVRSTHDQSSKMVFDQAKVECNDADARSPDRSELRSNDREGASSSASSSNENFTNDQAHRYIKEDGGALMSTMDFFHKFGWLSAPPISRQRRARVTEALRRHRITHAQDRTALQVYVDHAKAVFKVEYASFMVASTNDEHMFVLAQNGGDSTVKKVERTVTLCSHGMVLPQGETMVVNDTLTDWRFEKCPPTLAGSICSAAGRPMRFYASVPLFLSHALHGKEGVVQVGRLCLLAEKPRDDFGEADARLLYTIATMATDSLEKEYQSRKNQKAAEMQKRTSSLIRSLDDAIVNEAKVSDPLVNLKSAGSGSDNSASASAPPYATSVVDRACQQIQHCLDSTAVAVIDVGNFRMSRFRGPAASAKVPSAQSPSILTDRNSVGSTIPSLGYLSGDWKTSELSQNTAQLPSDKVKPLRALHVREDAPAPSLLAFYGPAELTPTMPDDPEQSKSVFAEALSSSVNETGMVVRCKMYHRGHNEADDADSESADEEGHNELLDRLARRDQDTWSAIMPSEDDVKSYAVCVCYDRTKARSLIAFFIMFTEDVSFDQQDKYFVESCAQISLSSLLRQRLSRVDFFQADFLRHVQHNMRTPLHGAMGAVDYLRAAIHGEDEERSASIDLSPNGVLATLLESISLSGATLNSYIDDLLAFQSLADVKPGVEAAKFTSIDLVKLVESVVNEEWEIAQRLELQSQTLVEDAFNGKQGPLCGMELIIKATEEVRESQWLIKVEYISQIVRRVVSNAIRFTRQGYIEVSLRVGANSPGSTKTTCPLEIVIVDTGIGMTQEFAATQLTKPFTKGDSFRDGIGLGMTIVSSTLQKLGGKLSVASEVNVGTTITVCIPLERSSAPHTNNSSMPSRSALNLATRTIAYHGMETRGLRRLANSIWEHFQPAGGMRVTKDLAQADCVVLSERSLLSLSTGATPLLTQFKPDARFILLPIAPVLRKPIGVEVLDGRAVMSFLLPHGPTALRLLEIFLSEENPLIIKIRPPLHARRETEEEVAGSLRASAAGHRLQATSASNHAIDKDDDLSSMPAHSKLDRVKPPFARTNTTASRTALDDADFRVLIVEDNPINMKLLTTLCDRLDILYERAFDGAEAVTKFISFKPAVVLLDLSLPIQDGFEACMQMRTYNHPCYIVAVTALSSEDDKARGIETCGMDRWMTKPVSPRELRKQLCQWRDNYHSDREAKAEQLKRYLEFLQSKSGEHVLAFSS